VHNFWGEAIVNANQNPTSLDKGFGFRA